MEIEFASQQTIKDLTGYKKPFAQKKWLANKGIKYEERGDKTPAVLKEHLRRVMGGIDEKEATKQDTHAEPNWDALNA
jgi:hypothetical protein